MLYDVSTGRSTAYDVSTGGAVKRATLSVTSDSPGAVAELALELARGESTFLDMRVRNAPVGWPAAYVRLTRSEDGDRYFEEVSTRPRRGWAKVRVPPGLLKTLLTGGRRLSEREADQVPIVRCPTHGLMRPVSVSGRRVKYVCPANAGHAEWVTLP